MLRFGESLAGDPDLGRWWHGAYFKEGVHTKDHGI